MFHVFTKTESLPLRQENSKHVCKTILPCQEKHAANTYKLTSHAFKSEPHLRSDV